MRLLSSSASATPQESPSLFCPWLCSRWCIINTLSTLFYIMRIFTLDKTESYFGNGWESSVGERTAEVEVDLLEVVIVIVGALQSV